MADQGRWFKENAELIEKEAGEADAVVSLGSVWPSDPLYAYARRYNLFIVNIDAAEPIDPLISGVSTIQYSVSENGGESGGIEGGAALSPYVWLSLSNAIKMSELIASDLKRLNPPDSDTVEKNLANLKSEILRLKAKYEIEIIDAEAFAALAVADEFVYFTDDFLIDVPGYFLKDGYYWEDADARRLQETMKETGVSVIISNIKPNDAVTSAVEEGGGTLAILESMDNNKAFDPESGQYMTVMERNLEIFVNSF
jgi:ABC-type Zn uptake system ZnuABC Zn-binding protein ZnuA